MGGENSAPLPPAMPLTKTKNSDEKETDENDATDEDEHVATLV